MIHEDEKDYIMRMIKEAARVLFSVLLGKQYTQVELPQENKYLVSGSSLDELKSMVDRGDINEAENRLLEDIDYSSREEVMAAVLFYEYICEKEEDFLSDHNYSFEEAVEGLKEVVKNAGYEEFIFGI